MLCQKFLPEAISTRAFSTASIRKSSCAFFFPRVPFRWTITSQNALSDHLHSGVKTGATWAPFAVLRQVPFSTASSKLQKQTVSGYMNTLNICSMDCPHMRMIQTELSSETYFHGQKLRSKNATA